MRPSKHQRAMMQAEFESMWATCIRKRVGTVATDIDGVVLATGRNGSPIGAPHCQDVNTRINLRCPFCIHSEKNLINHAARNGVSLKGSYIHTLYRPCEGCAKDLVQSKIASLIYRWDYDSDNENAHPAIIEQYGSVKGYVLQMFRDSDIRVLQLAMSPIELEFHRWLESISPSLYSR